MVLRRPPLTLPRQERFEAGPFPVGKSLAGIVNLAACKARVTARQYGSELHAAIWTQVSCRHTRKALARARRY